MARTMTTGKYFREVMALDSPYIGLIVRETFDKIVVFGEGNDRYDIPKSEIQTTGRSVRATIEKKYLQDLQLPLL
jgi:hypothetical protein